MFFAERGEVGSALFSGEDINLRQDVRDLRVNMCPTRGEANTDAPGIDLPERPTGILIAGLQRIRLGEDHDAIDEQRRVPARLFDIWWAEPNHAQGRLQDSIMTAASVARIAVHVGPGTSILEARPRTFRPSPSARTNGAPTFLSTAADPVGGAFPSEEGDAADRFLQTRPALQLTFR